MRNRVNGGALVSDGQLFVFVSHYFQKALSVTQPRHFNTVSILKMSIGPKNNYFPPAQLSSPGKVGILRISKTISASKKIVLVIFGEYNEKEAACNTPSA